MKYKTHKINQQSDDWFKIRKGKMTASHAQAIGNCGKGLDTYILELMAEYYSNAIKENFESEDTKRGNELENEARMIYELENNCIVEQVGFLEVDDYVGCSPDGLISKDGLIEIKCPNDKNYLSVLLSNKVPSEYEWQGQMQLLITEREWIDFMFYNPNFKKSFIIIRKLKDKRMIKDLEIGINKGREKIKEIKQIYENTNKD